MKRWLAVLACTLLLGGAFSSLPAVQAQDGPTATEPAAIPAELQAAFDAALAQNPDKDAPLPYEVFIDNVIYSQDGQSAVLWLGFRDAATGEVIAGEPGLALARLSAAPDAVGLAQAGWAVTLPVSPDWSAAFGALPADLATPELEMFAGVEQPSLAPQASGQVFSGYKLPWAGGKSVRLSGSIWHVWGTGASCPSTCRWAFDFADGTMFPLLAAKGGTILGAGDSCPNGSTSCTNFLTIKDSSTTPVTYQIYLHLAQGSIPAALKTVGAPVIQGQYIGNVDDTGYSSGHHLHFHVTDSVYWSSSGYYWGNSVDITFDDVPINGGRPRTCAETTWAVDDPYDQCIDGNWFLSGNYGAYPPTAALTLPAAGEVISNGSMLMAGQAWDDIGVMKAQAIFKINGAWQLGGPAQTLTGATYETYLMDIDLCTTAAPLGNVEVGVRVWDYEGNASIDPQSVRTVTNRTFCKPKPPACQPTANQVALYSGANYTGSCKLLGAGDYASASAFSPVPDNELSSLLVGANVQAVLFDEPSMGKRSETIARNDPNLDDNRLGDNRMSSLRVTARTLAAAAPALNAPFNITTTPVTSADSLVLDWTAPGAVSFQSTLNGPLALALDWTDSNGWSVGSLPAGKYTWTVKAKTASGAEVSNTSTFSVAAASLPAAPPLGVPASQLEDAGGWTATSGGLWNYLTGYTLGGRSLNGWLYSNPAKGSMSSPSVGGSDLTSPPFTVPAGQAWLAFDYNTLTEGVGPYWDQRWVQISVNGGRFENLRQMYDERMDAWLSSPWIDLSPYAGQSVRLRFHLDIVDSSYNGDLPGGGLARGWAIDNVRVFTAGRPACFEASNETPAQATAIGTTANVQAGICPAGDVDFYRVRLLADQGIQVTLTPGGAALEMALFDADGRSVQQSGTTNLNVYATAAGDYYLRVRALDHPGVGGDQVTYNLRVESYAPVSQMQPLPAVTNSTAVLLRWDASETVFGLGRFELQVDAGNTGSWALLDGAIPGSARAYWFVGQPGVKYAFRLRAVDNGGNAEAWPSAAEAVTQLAATCAGDPFESSDDTPAGAVVSVPGAPAQERNLCGQNNPDWMKVSAKAREALWVLVRPVSGGAAVKISLYAPGNTTTPIATAQSGGLGQGVLLRWKTASAGDYLVKIEPLRGDLLGTDTRYSTWAGVPKDQYLPVVGKN